MREFVVVESVVVWIFFFFSSRRRHTRCLSDRSSDVCSSDLDGRFIGLRIQWICNVGAYLSQAGPLINTLNPSTHAINVYRIPALYGRHRLALTNTTPITAYRGAGRPNVTYLVERLVDEAAREMGIDRVELRRRNFI